MQRHNAGPRKRKRNDGPRIWSVLADITRILGTVITVIWEITTK